MGRTVERKAARLNWRPAISPEWSMALPHAHVPRWVVDGRVGSKIQVLCQHDT